MAIKCKRIIDGKTYNTETATQLAGWDDDEGPFEGGRYLYQTRFGAFFLYVWGGPDEAKPLFPTRQSRLANGLKNIRAIRSISSNDCLAKCPRPALEN